MIDIYKDSYQDFRCHLAIPNIYSSGENFIERYCFDETDTNSIYSNLMRAYDNGITFMKELHQKFEYVQGVTDITTTAEEAMKLGKGVCQDYSHIMLSLCRMEKSEYCRAENDKRRRNLEKKQAVNIDRLSLHCLFFLISSPHTR